MREDQATGLRRLFTRGRQHTLAVCGSGATRVAVNLAASMAGLGHRVLILDRSRGEVPAALAIKARYDLVHALEGHKPVEEVLLAAGEGLMVLPAARGLERLAVECADWQQALRTALPALGVTFDIWIVNGLPPGAAPEAPVVLVLAPTARAITTAYGQIKALARAQGRHDFAVVVCRAATTEAAHKVFNCVAETAGRFLAARLQLLGLVPRERASPRAQAIIATPDSPPASAFQSLAQALLGVMHSDQLRRVAPL